MAKKKYEYKTIRGEAGYAKILGDPVFGYKNKYKHWSVDVVLSPAGVKDVKEAGLEHKIKEGKETKDGEPLYDGRPFISFSSKVRDESNLDQDRIKVQDSFGNSWPENRLIGNGSIIDMRFLVIPDEEDATYTGVYPKAVRVLKHVPYEADDFEPLDEDDEFYQAAQELEEESTDAGKANRDDDLDDEIPID